MNIIQKMRMGLHIMDIILWTNEERLPLFVFVEEQRQYLRELGFTTDIIVVSLRELPDVKELLSNPLTPESRKIMKRLVDQQQ